MAKKAHSIIFSLFFTFFIMPLSGQSLALDKLLENLELTLIQNLESDGQIFRYDRNSNGIMLIPEHSSLEVIKRQYQQLQPDVLVEGLYLIPYPAGTKGIDLRLYNITRTVSAISEVEYYSGRRKAIVPLFDNVYRIEDLRGKKRLDDPIVNDIPLYDSILMHMKEVNLGTGYYETQYVYDGESLGIFFKNVTPLRALIKIVEKEEMLIDVVILSTQKGYLVYGFCAVKFRNRNFVFNMMDPYSSFYKRLFAIVTWVKNSLHNSDEDPLIGEELDF